MQNEQDNQRRQILLVDTTFLFDQFSRRGIGVYGRNVVKRLIETVLEEDKYEIHLLGFSNLKQNLIELEYSQFKIEELIPYIKFHSLGKPVLSSISNVFLFNKLYKPIIEEVRPDVYYAVHFERGLPSTTYLNKSLTLKPKTVVMAHDAIPIILNKFSSKGFIQNQLKKAFYMFMWSGIKNADLVLTNSNKSKEDLINYGGIAAEKIKAIYLGIDASFFKENSHQDKDIVFNTLRAYNVLDERYFIYDSGIEANKGSDELLKLFSEFIKLDEKKLPNKLLIIGKDFYKGKGRSIKPRTLLGEKFYYQAKRLKILDNLITTDRINDDSLKILLFHAFAHINLSKYEGFSFGPLQAMAAEVPAIVRNSSCIPEVTKEKAFMLDVNDDTDFSKLAEKIKIFLLNDKEVDKLVKEGKKVALEYNWKTTVDETWEEIKKLF